MPADQGECEDERDPDHLYVRSGQSTGYQTGLCLRGADYITKPFVPDIVKARINIHLKLYETTRQLQDMNHKLQLSVIEQLRRVENEKRNVLYALLRLPEKMLPMMWRIWNASVRIAVSWQKPCN